MNYFQKDVVKFLNAFLNSKGYFQTSEFEKKEFLYSYKKELDDKVIFTIRFQCSNSFRSSNDYQFTVELSRISYSETWKNAVNLNARLIHVLEFAYQLKDYEMHGHWWRFVREGGEEGVYREIAHLLNHYGIPWLENPGTIDLGNLNVQEYAYFMDIIESVISSELSKHNFESEKHFHKSEVRFINQRYKPLIQTISFSLFKDKSNEIYMEVYLYQARTEDREKELIKSVTLRHLLLLNNEINPREINESWRVDDYTMFYEFMLTIRRYIFLYALVWLSDENSPDIGQIMQMKIMQMKNDGLLD